MELNLDPKINFGNKICENRQKLVKKMGKIFPVNFFGLSTGRRRRWAAKREG
jgi:hypothetical protein